MSMLVNTRGFLEHTDVSKADEQHRHLRRRCCAVCHVQAKPRPASEDGGLRSNKNDWISWIPELDILEWQEWARVAGAMRDLTMRTGLFLRISIDKKLSAGIGIVQPFTLALAVR